MNGDNNFRFYTSGRNGGIASAFSSLDRAFLDASGTLSAMPGKYTFSVHEPLCSADGDYLEDYEPLLAPVACRTFNVDMEGQIVSRDADAVGGAPCPNSTDVDTTNENNGGLTIQIMPPYDVNPQICRDGSGAAIYMAYVYTSSNPDVTNLFFTVPTAGGGDGSGSGSGGGSASGSGSDSGSGGGSSHCGV
ncbi:MAG: hypothetical protein JO257_08225 [Deltaproteobacteria bacterium]|nr:hypothetical protein [Deltaproteobacteria bacterium]